MWCNRMSTPAAIRFGKSIKTLFLARKDVTPFRADEIKKFSALSECFNAIHNCVRVDNYHGKTSLVEFDAPAGIQHLVRNDGSRPRCELSDLLFITYSLDEIRVSFLQAKATTNYSPFPIYLGNTEQYALLKHRPVILNWLGKKEWPNDILQSA